MSTARNYPSTHMRDRARNLRHTHTDAERFLWNKLRNRGLEGAKFRRQQPIGPFIADFFCAAHGLVIELDGGQHASEMSTDADRTAYLQQQGYRVLRFWNHDVLTQLDAVVAQIVEALQSPHPSPLPEGEGVLGKASGQEDQ
jgi:very-short-patch-repair endonuclease